MSWYLYSILSSLSFTGMVLSVKQLSNYGFTAKQTLFFICSIVFLGFIFLNVESFKTIFITKDFLTFLIVVLTAGIFSVIANIGIFEGVRRSPNPGYSIAITNNTTFLIAFFSVLIFGSSLNILKFLGMLFIAIGILTIVVERENINSNHKNKWFIFSFIALFSLATMTLIVKEITQLKGFGSKEINLFIFGFLAIAFYFLSKKENKFFLKNKKIKKYFPLLVLASIFSFLGNYFNVTALGIAPNPGYSDAIKNTNILFITLLSIKIFSTKFEKFKILGVIAIMAGIIILVV